MLQFNQHIPPRSPSIKLAPMIDVVFLLLIFFIVTWNMAKFETELDIVVPASTKGEHEDRQQGEIIVNVKKNGGIFINNKKLNINELLVMLKKISSLYKDQAVILRGDQHVDYKHIIAVLDACKEANIWNVAFATNSVEKNN